MDIVNLFYIFLVLFTLGTVTWFIIQYKKEKRTLLIGGLFLLALGSIFVLLVFTMVRFFEDTQFGYTILWFLIALLGIFLVFFIMLFPVSVVSVFIFSGIRLIRKEGFSLAHGLSLIAGIVYSLYLVIWPILNDWFANDFYAYIYSLFSFLFTYTLFVFCLFTLSSWINQWKVFGKTYDYIIVLGSGLLNGYRVPPLLASRIDKALTLHEKHPGSKLVFSGGQGENEQLPEAEAMAEYARTKGLPEEFILIEDQSKNTNQNIRFSKEFIREHGKNKDENVIIVTNRYHLFRALLTAKEENLRCDGSGSKTKFYFSLNGFLREFIAYLFYWKKYYFIGFSIGAGLLTLYYTVYWIVLYLM